MNACPIAAPGAALHTPDKAFTQTLRRAKLALAVTSLGLGLPLALVPVDGALIAPGEVTVASEVKQIRHPRGGVLAQVLVANGSRVQAGQVLMRFDGTVSSANAALASASVDQLLAREARLRAERDDLGAVTFPPALLARQHDPTVAEALSRERRIFSLNRASLAGQRAALSAQMAQAAKAADNYRTQADVFRQQAVLIAEERAANDRLWEKRFTTLQRRNELARAAVGLDGSVASAEAQASQVGSRMAELRQQALLLDHDARRAAGTELAQVEARLIELRQNALAAQEGDARNTLRAPHDGIVDKLAFATQGSFVPAGETILEIVPDHEPLRIAARVRTADIDQVRTGQTTTVRFSGFDAQTTAEIHGQVVRIGANRTIDTRLGATFYEVDISIPAAELARLRPLELRAGMPAEAFIRTEARTLLGYVLKPLANQIARAFR